MSVPIHTTGHSGRPEIAISTAAGVVTLSLTCLTRKVPRSFTPPRLSVLQGQMGMRPWRATVCGQVCARAVETKQTNTREATKRTVRYTCTLCCRPRPRTTTTDTSVHEKVWTWYKVIPRIGNLLATMGSTSPLPTPSPIFDDISGQP